MPLVTFLPSGKTVDASPGTLLSDAARAAGVSAELPCGGKGVCRRCIVRIVSGEVDAAPDMPRPGPDGMAAYACRDRVGAGPLVVEAGGGFGDGRFTDFNEDFMAIDAELKPVGCEPPVSRIELAVPEARQGDGLSDLDRLRRAAQAAVSGRALELSLDILADLPCVLRENDGRVILRYAVINGTAHVVSLTAADYRACGLAVDIGTTTVAAYLTDMETGAIMASESAYNAQIDCGLDVISRINYARDEKRILELKAKVLETVNGLIGGMAGRLGIERGHIAAASLAGNTTMVHLLLGIIPEYIRLHPYTPAVYDVPSYTARELDLDICPHAPVLIAPSVGSYVGGDITAGLLCTRLADDAAGDTMLFIDIGTNGEIVLGNGDFLLSCACSAGPAFEGGGIRHGCRASTGAIERVELDESGAASCSTIGGAPPIGICGSGIISLVAELFKKGFIDASGRFADKAPLITSEGRKCFPLTDGEEPITVSETDIDNLIRAKAAVFSACQTLLDSVGLTFGELEHVYVAGGFGRFLNMDDAASIGLLPRPKSMTFLGNTSLNGAYMALISERHRQRLRDAAGRITYIDLSAEPGYMDAYMAALFLPHTSFKFE